MPKSHIFNHCADCGSEFMTRRKTTSKGPRRDRCYRCEAKRWNHAANMLEAFGMKGFSYASAKR